MSEININVQETTENVEIVAVPNVQNVNITPQNIVENIEIVTQPNVYEVNITRVIGGGAVDSVNGQTGVVVLDATDVGAYTTGQVDTLLIGKFNNPTGDNTQYLDGAGTPTTFPSLTGFVPYIGATQDVVLGPHSISSATGIYQFNDNNNQIALEKLEHYNRIYMDTTDTSSDEFGRFILEANPEQGLYVSHDKAGVNGSYFRLNRDGIEGYAYDDTSGLVENRFLFNKNELNVLKPISLPKTVFNSNTETAGEKELVWNDQDGTLDLGLKGGNVTLQIGQESVIRVVNKTGSNLLEANYQAVRVDGAQGNRLKIALAQATTDLLSAETIGLVTETINDNQEGFVTTNGIVRNIDTTGSLQGETWADGDMLYLSPTVAGRLTKVKPVAPNHLVVIGYVVRAHATQGQIFVKVDNGYELDELHNVAINSPANNNVLTYNSATDVWENKTVVQALGYTPLPTQAGSTTGTVVTFVTDRVYGTIASPETGNITADVTGAQIGVTNIIIHNSGTAPTFGSEFKKLSGSGNYITSQVNYIYCTFINSTEIIYSINQRT